MKALLRVLVPLLVIASPVLADDTEHLIFGGDQYVAGQNSAPIGAVNNDVFAAGKDVTLTTPIGGDAHAAGLNVIISAPVDGNIYAAANTITLTAPIGKDVLVLGGTVNLTGFDAIEGNLRGAAGTVVLERPVNGSVMLAGASLKINAPIAGDVLLSGESITFGDKARVEGTVEIRATEEIPVPASVAPASRVTFTKIDKSSIIGDAGNIAGQTVQRGGPSWMGPVFGAVALIVFGSILLAIFPRRAEIGYLTAMAKPWKSLFYGVLAASAYVGLILVLLASLIGIPLIPVAIVLLVLAGLTGFVAGTYFVADRVLFQFGYETDTLWKRIGALTMGLIAVWILGAIPLIGLLAWFVQFALGLFGLGALSFSAIGRRIDSTFHRELAASVNR